MFRPLPLSIGWRYLRAKRRNGFISFLSMAAILGIVIGVAALIVTISVMSGFQHEFRERMLGLTAHATVAGVDGTLRDWEHAVRAAGADPRVLGAAPYVQVQALLQGGHRRGAIVRGVDPRLEPGVSDLADRMTQGSMLDLVAGESGIVLGSELARSLRVDVGDRLNVFVPASGGTPTAPSARRFTVVGILRAGVQEVDLGIALINLADAQALTGMGDGVSGVRLKVAEPDQAGAVARDLARTLDEHYRVRDWSRDHVGVFQMLQLQKTVMFVLLSLVIAVAAFNLVSSLVMLVQDKQSDIAVLRTLGMAPGAVMAIFVAQGLAIGLLGIGTGVAAGVALAANLAHVVAAAEALFAVELMPADVYAIGGVPTAVLAADVASVAAVAFVLCLLATLYPAWRASRLDPATALSLA